MVDAPTADPVERFQGAWRAGNRPDLSAFLTDSGVRDPAQRLDLIREDQYLRWQAGERVPAEAYLPLLPDGSTEDALILIWAEVRTRVGRGEAPDLGEYQRRFPQFADALARQFELEKMLGSLSNRTLVIDRGADGPVGAEPTPPGYEILGEIGRGAMGVVYRARQVGLNRIVALKVLRERDAADADRVGRFQQEAALAARHQHPNIVQVFEYGVAAGRPFLAMEYVAGRTLAQAAGGQPQSPREAACQVETLAEAIHFAHTHGVVHRDLKPANVLIAEDGRLKVVDFGLAKELREGSSQTATGVVLGTPAYMAPEQAASHARLVGPATDEWALGAILYELLTGRPPFRGESPVATLQLVITTEPTAPSRLVKVPKDIETICLKCLEKDPARRYRSAAALAEDLRRFQAGESIAARPVWPWERAGRWAKRNPTWAATLGSVVALLAVIAVGGVVGSVRLSKQAADARAAERDAADRLWEAQVARARALRTANGPNARQESLALLRIAAATRVTDELRNEYIAALALPDVAVEREWGGWPDGSVAVSFSADFRWYARMDASDTISVRQSDGDVEVGRITGPGPAANHVWMTPDGAGVLAQFGTPGDAAYRLVYWRRDASAFRRLWEKAGRSFETKVVFSPDARRVVVTDAAEGRAWVVDAVSGTELREFTIPRTRDGLTPDHHPREPRLAVAADNAVRIYDLETGREVARVGLPGGPSVGHVRWHPTGNRLLLAWDAPGGEKIGLVDVATGKPLVTYDGHVGHGANGAFEPNGPLVATNHWGDILRVFDAGTGLPLFQTPANTSQGLHFTPHGLVGPAIIGTRLQLFRVAPSPTFRTIPFPRGDLMVLAEVDADNRSLAVGTGSELSVWDLDTGRRTARRDAKAYPMHFEKSGILLALGESGLTRWCLDRDPATGTIAAERLVTVWPNFRAIAAYSASMKAIASFCGTFVQVAFPWQARLPINLPHMDARFIIVSRDGRWVVTCSHFPTPGDPFNVKVWDMTAADPTRPVRELPVGMAAHAAFSPDGTWLATATLNGGCRLWHVGTWEPGPTIGGNYPLFTPDGKFLVTETGQGVLRLCEAATGREVVRLTSPLPTRMRSLCYSPDGGRLVVWGRETGAIHVWELSAIRAELQIAGLDW